jgi:hypothetical protein
MRLPLAAFSLSVLACAYALPQAPPAAMKDIASISARDSHEGLLIAAEPLLGAEEYKTRFGKKNPYESGIVAIDVYFRNDEDVPVQLELSEIRLTVRLPGQALQDIPALDAKTVASEVYAEKPKDPTKRARFPIPGVGNSKPGKDFFELENKLQQGMLKSDMIPGRGTVHGLFYFDVDGNFAWIAMSKFYVPNLKRVPTGKPLLFFEVPFTSAGS